MREPVVDSVDGQSAEDDLVSGLIDDCAGQLEKNNLWDSNAGSSIKHFSDMYNIASQEGDDDDDSLSFDRLLGHTRLEKSPMESWMAAISCSSDVDTTTGINILANASVLRPMIPAAILPAAGLLNSAVNSLSQDQTLLPMVRPADRMSIIPVIEQSAASKLSFALARNELPGCPAVNVATNQSLPATMSPGQSTVPPQTWTSVGNGEANRTHPPKAAQLKPARSRANRPKMEMSKPAMNEKESHELERVMDILKRYKQQLAEGDQIGQFLPCKRKRSKPPSQSVDSSSSYSKPSDVEPAEHERAQAFDLTNSKCEDRQTFSNPSYCESKPPADASAPQSTDRIGVSPNNGKVNPSGGLTNSAVYSAILASNDSASSFSPGNSYGATPPVSALQYSPGAVDQASRCTSVGIDYQMEPPPQTVTRHQSSLAAAGYAPNPFGENIPDSTLVNLPVNTELEKVSLSSHLCLQTGIPSTPSSTLERREETSSVAYSVSREAIVNSVNSLTADGEDSVKFTKLTFEQIQQNLPEPIPICKCLSSNGESSDESKEGPYYTQLGAAESVARIREIMENRFGITGLALRIEKITYTGKEGKNPNGCPIAKWIIRRSGEREKVLCLVRKRLGHSCDTAVIVVGIVVWEGVENSQTPNELYDYLTRILSLHGVSTDRRCGSNDQKTCCCQGWDEATGGASFTFGCSWSMFYNGCKFAKSSAPRKFRLKKQQEEEKLEKCLNQLASAITPLYARAAPKSFHNQTQATNANECRLGYTREKPWSGVTAVVDYCTHSHKDINNMQNGCVAVVTLTKHRSRLETPEDEQLHVLPLYVMDSTDEFDSVDGQRAKFLSGAVECLTQFPSLMRVQQHKPSCHPRRNYRNKSKMHAGPTDKIQKKAAKVTTLKRIRPPSSRTARLTLQKLQTATEKLLEMKDEKPGSCGETAEPRGQPGEETSNNDSRTEEAEKQGIMGDNIVKSGQDVDLGTALCNGRSEYDETASQKAYACAENSNVAQSQQTLESQICESVSDLTPRQIADVMKSLNALPETNVAALPMSQHVSAENLQNLQVLWNLENGENSRADICSGNQWMKRIEEAADLRNNDISSQDSGGMTTVGLSMGFQSIQRSDAVAGGHANTCCDEQTIDQETPVVDDGAGLPASSAMLSMPSAYAEKCGGFLQLLNGDDDLSYNEGCLNSGGEFCPSYLHQQELLNEKGDYAKASDDSAVSDVRGGGASSSKNKPGAESRKETPTKNEHAFKDSNIGGVAIALTHGSVFFEVAKRELHATTAVKNPNRVSPTRIALIFYQHKHLNHPDHGNSKQSAKELEQDHVELSVKDSASLDERQSQSTSSLSQLNVETVIRSGSSRDDVQSVYGNLAAVSETLWTAPVNNVHTLTTTTMVTKWIQPKLATSGPYQCWG